MEPLQFLALFAGGAIAGVINVMAGGAGFMTFPLLIATGLNEMEANACNFVALLPANVVGSVVYRRELRELHEHLLIRLFLALLGGVLGAWLFVHLGEASFEAAIPWLLVFATLSFAIGPWVRDHLQGRPGFDARRWLWLSFLLEFVVYLYGGYFGLGMGIILLAIHSIFSHMSVHHANALRNLTVTVMTLMGIGVFVGAGLVRWGHAFAMMGGTIAGGYVTAHFARQVPAAKVRKGILAWSLVLTAWSFWRYA